MLLDGSITTPVPVGAVMEAGAAWVVAGDVCSPVDRADVLFRAWNWGKDLPIYALLGLSDLSHFVKPVVPESIKIVGRTLKLSDSCSKTSSSVSPPTHY